MKITWMPVFPPWLVAVVTLVLLLLLVRGSLMLARKRLPRRWIVMLGLLRLAVVLVFGLCLLQPAVSFHHTVQEGPPVLVLLDASRSMGIKNAAAPDGRLAETVQWLGKSGLRDAISARPGARWFAFAGRARAVAADDLAVLKPEGATTHFAESLADAWEQYRQQGSDDAPVAHGGRVLLVSDGNDFSSRDVTDVARQLGLAIDTLAPADAGAAAGGTGISIVNVQAPRTVMLGAESRFGVAVRQEGLAGKPLTLRLKDGDKVVASQPFTFASAQKEKLVSLSFHPEEAGLKEYSVEIEGAPAGESNEAGARRFSVQVAGARNEVLFLEDNWRWEFKFLRRIFEDDPGFTLTAFLSRGENAFVQLAEPDRRTQVTGFPQSRAELAGFDTLVLGSTDPRRWPRGFAKALLQLVEEEGKSLVIIAGPNLRPMLEQPALAALLPVDMSAESATPVNGPVPVRVTAEGLGTPFFATPAGAPADFWSSLPAMDQIYPPLRKKPGATVLAEAAQLSNPYGNLILIAGHTVGRGRVLFVGTDTLWKWQMLSKETEGPTAYQVFWQQALRALAPIRQSSGNVNLNLEPERSRYEPGQTVVLRAEVRAERALPKCRLQAQVTLPDGRQLALEFSPSPTEPGIHTARFDVSMPGQHKVAATAAVDDKTAADTLIAFDVGDSGTELANPQVNEANLDRIAHDTGGQRINRADASTWSALGSVAKVPVTRVRTLDLWNSFVLLILLSVLLGIDWLVRLLRGFA